MQEPEPALDGTQAPSEEELKRCYTVAARSRATEESIVRLVNRGDVKFAIWGPGEEIHGTATALAFSKVVNPSHFGLIPHYRSGSLCSMWCELNGHTSFVEDLFRQQFSKDTDTMSRGRQMVYHLHLDHLGILPVQSPVGMQLGKAAGYAMGYKVKGVTDSVTVGIIGDGTTAEGDLHDFMNAASIWQLPVVVMITDNGVAISTNQHEGRGIRDFETYARAFGMESYSCDGRDFWDVHDTTLKCLTQVKDKQSPALLYVHDLPRFNGHSSAADVTFDLTQEDPLISFGEKLVELGILEDADILRRREGEGRDFFSHHDLGSIMEAETELVRATINRVRDEPDPPTDSIHTFIRAPFPEVDELPGEGETVITYAGAVRAALSNIIEYHGGVTWGQDIARLGGVMTATAGLAQRFPERVIDAPLNEPLIVGTACGAGLHEDIVTLPEIQFADYSLNAFHWLVHMGNVYWSTHGNARFRTILRMPVDPFGGGAIYHSMSVDGYFSGIPGLVIVMPSTSWDVYGLLMTAAEYQGPVVVLEPKWAYRLAMGPAFPDEPTESGAVDLLKKAIMRGEVPTLSPEHRVPFSKAAYRRRGDDLTIVSWGRAVSTALSAANTLAESGVSAEVIDLRTLVPPDLETVFESTQHTGRLLVAAEDRPFAGLVRSIQGAVVERFPGTPTVACGQKDVPGVAQSPILEKATVLTDKNIVASAEQILEADISPESGWCWIPSRYSNG